MQYFQRFPNWKYDILIDRSAARWLIINQLFVIERNELGNTMKNEIVSLGIVSRCTDYIKVADRNDIKNDVAFIGSVTFLFKPVCPFLYILPLSFIS